MFIFFFFFASALSALHLYNEPKFMVTDNPVILEQSHAYNAPDLWDRGSKPLLYKGRWHCITVYYYEHILLCTNNAVLFLCGIPAWRLIM